MGGRGLSGMILAAGMVAMASIAGPAMTTAATGPGERKSRGGTRLASPRVERKNKSEGLAKMLATGRRRGRC